MKPGQRRIWAAGACCALAVLATGCNGGNTAGFDTGGNDSDVYAVPTADSAPQAPNKVQPERLLVQRGKSLGEESANVLVRLSWHHGEGSQPNKVDVKQGQKVEVHIWSDRSAKISVSGHPDSDSDVAPNDPEGVDFTVSSPTTVVSVGGDKVATFVAH